MKFVIVSPIQVFGGPIVLHKLCELLNKNGHDAKIYNFDTLPDDSKTVIGYWFSFFVKEIKHIIKIILSKFLSESNKFSRKYLNGYYYFPIKKQPKKIFPIVDSNTIIVYPEIIYGNPLHAKKVVRWLLYHNRFKGDSNAYGKDDLFFCFRDYFNDVDLNPSGRKIQLNNFDYELYKQTNFEERFGKCYMIRKGKSRTDLPMNFDGPVLDNLPEKEIVKAFNKYKYCYFYDTQTFYSSIASICGCIPIIVCEEGKTRYDYLGNDDKSYGIAYGDSKEEIDYAINTKEMKMKKIMGYEEKNEKNIMNFINECERYFMK